MDLSVLTLARTLPDHARGGMEEASWNLAKAIARSGVRVTILTTGTEHRFQSWNRDGVVGYGLDYVPVRLRTKAPHRWWRYFGRAAAAFAKHHGLEVDIVHSQSFYADGFLLESSRPPIVATIHGTTYGDYVGGTREKLLKEVGRAHPRRVLQRLSVSQATRREVWQLRRVDAIVAVSEIIAKMLPGVRRDDPRLKVIPNGIDPNGFPFWERGRAREALGLPMDKRILLFLGRVEEYKGPGRLLDVLPRFPDAILAVAGTGPFLEELRSKVRDHPARDRVVVLGPVPDEERAKLYAAADLFCLPSRREGQPVSLLESLAMGTPVATTQAWLPRELLPFAAVHPDAQRMVEMGLALSEGLDPMAPRQAVLSRFTWERIGEDYVRLFQRMVEVAA